MPINPVINVENTLSGIFTVLPVNISIKYVIVNNFNGNINAIKAFKRMILLICIVIGLYKSLNISTMRINANKGASYGKTIIPKLNFAAI